VSTHALEAEHLPRAVFGKAITKNISVQVHVGEILAVVGPSGSGKSSFLRLLNRLDEPTDGVVRFDGQDYRSASPIYAGIFQFIVVAMILAASGIAGLVPCSCGREFSRLLHN